MRCGPRWVAFPSGSRTVFYLRRVLPQSYFDGLEGAPEAPAEVVYFPVSAFGHSPTKLPDGRMAPDPKKLHPMFVELPMIWALSRIVPGMIPTINNPTET